MRFRMNKKMDPIRAIAALLKAEEKERLRELRKKEFDLDFKLWILPRKYRPRSPYAQLPKDVLRQMFCEETGRRDPYLDEEEAERRR